MVPYLPRRVVLICLIIILSGCATTPSRISPDTLAKIKNVRVMSLVGHEFHRQYTGLTVFGNEYEKNDISAWKIDDEYEAQIEGILEKLGRFQVKQVPYDRKEFYSVYELKGPWDAPAFRGPNWQAVEEKLKAFSQKHSLDAVIVVIRSVSGDFLTMTNQYIRGAGFYVRGVGETTAVSMLHLMAYVALIDGQTGKPLAIKMLTRTQDGLPGGSPRAAPMNPVAPELSRSQFKDLDKNKMDQIKNSLIDLPKESWEPTLRAILVTGSN